MLSNRTIITVQFILIIIIIGILIYFNTSGTKTVVLHEKGKATTHGIDVFSKDGKHVGFGIHLEETDKR